MEEKRTEFLKQVVEALVFASDVPISAEQIRGVVEEVTVAQIRKMVDEMNHEYNSAGRAFQIIRVANGYQMATRELYASWIRKFLQKRSSSKLTQAALETLSVIAFRQPVGKSEISNIRGVNCDGVMRTLLERKLVTISGRSQGPGRPLLYKTTREFLRYFGLDEISDLPKPREIEELLKEDKHLPEDAVE